MRKKIVLLYLCAALGGVYASCASVSAQGVRETVLQALDQHPAIEGAEYNHKAAQHDKEAEYSGFYPEISASATAGRVFQDNSTSRGLTVDRGAAYSGFGEGNIALKQMLFDGLETKFRVHAANARIEHSFYNLLDVKSGIVLRAAQSHIDILRVRSALLLLEDQMSLIEDYVSRISDLVTDGGADETELQQARDVFMIASGTRADYEGQLAAAEASYFEVTGQMPADDLDIPKTLASEINENISDVLREVKENHPMLMAARMTSKAARHDMKAEHSKIYPDISGELSYLKNDKKDLVGGEARDARAVVRMNWNFSTGGREFSSVRKKREEHYEALSNYEVMERELQRDIYQSYAMRRTFARKLQLAKERVDLNEKLLQTYVTQFEGARISLLSLMKTESQLFNARLEESDNIYYHLSSEYTVLSYLGRIHDVVTNETALETLE
ncbi:MAG: TolC family protein [Alphaproteobacteria bacterium]